MDAREQRGLEIAATIKLRKHRGVWLVPSQGDRSVTYAVDLNGDAPKCSCPDHEVRRVKCKHIHAVEFSVKRETRPDGTMTVTKTVRVTYGQHWPAYNTTQTCEKTRVSELLRGLCDGIYQPAQGRGRPDSLGRNAGCPTNRP